MTPFPRHTAMAAVLAAGWSSSRCECAERKLHDGLSSTSTMELEASAAGTTTGAESTAHPTDDTESTVNVSRFMGLFHNENQFIPFGMETMNTHDASIANLEIREDGTASMVMETCNEGFGPLEIAWRWEPHPGPRLDFMPGPGEDTLRFMTLTNVETMWAFIDDACELVFQIDGVNIHSQTFRPGKACWVNRCEPAWTVHIDYCDGEAPPQCE